MSSSSCSESIPVLGYPVGTLLSGASFVYVSLKAPFFWGGIYLPGIVLLNVWALSTIAGAMVYL